MGIEDQNSDLLLPIPPPLPSLWQPRSCWSHLAVRLRVRNPNLQPQIRTRPQPGSEPTGYSEFWMLKIRSWTGSWDGGQKQSKAKASQSQSYKSSQGQESKATDHTRLREPGGVRLVCLAAFKAVLWQDQLPASTAANDWLIEGWLIAFPRGISTSLGYRIMLHFACVPPGPITFAFFSWPYDLSL